MKRQLAITILICSLLTSCAVAVLVGATATGLIVYDKRSLPVLESDARIFHKVHNAIVTDPRFRNSHIMVCSFNEVVLLVGQTPVASLRVVANKIAQSTPNVKRVYDEVTIDQPLSMAQRAEDTWITGQVRSFMLTQKGLESGSIRVLTENGVVYLMGIVTREQSALAVDVARRVEGVRKVVKIFQYLN